MNAPSDRKVEALLHPLFENAFQLIQCWTNFSLVAHSLLFAGDSEVILKDRNLQLSGCVKRKFKK